MMYAAIQRAHCRQVKKQFLSETTRTLSCDMHCELRCACQAKPTSVPRVSCSNCSALSTQHWFSHHRKHKLELKAWTTLAGIISAVGIVYQYGFNLAWYQRAGTLLVAVRRL